MTPVGRSNRAGLVLLAALTLVASGCRSAHADTGPFVSLSGTGRQDSTVFALPAGYYVITRTLAAGAPRCLFAALVQSAQSAWSIPIDGPLSEAGEKQTFASADHYVSGGTYQVVVRSTCGQWSVVIGRQVLFDRGTWALQ